MSRRPGRDAGRPDVQDPRDRTSGTGDDDDPPRSADAAGVLPRSCGDGNEPPGAVGVRRDAAPRQPAARPAVRQRRLPRHPVARRRGPPAVRRGSGGPWWAGSRPATGPRPARPPGSRSRTFRDCPWRRRRGRGSPPPLPRERSRTSPDRSARSRVRGCHRSRAADGDGPDVPRQEGDDGGAGGAHDPRPPAEDDVHACWTPRALILVRRRDLSAARSGFVVVAG
jgi:hypothetical protein